MLPERVYSILWIIAACGGMTAAQISVLLFPPAMLKRKGDKLLPAPKSIVHSNCQSWLKRLRKIGYLRRIERYQLLSEGKKSYVYAVTERGAQALAAHLGCEVQDLQWRRTDVRLKPEYLEHLILTNDVRI